VFRSDRDLIGVLTFGTAKKVPASLDFHHLALVAELDRPNIENILALERLLGDEGQQHFQKEFGTSHQVAIHEVLWYSQSLFAAVKERQSTADFYRSGFVFSSVLPTHFQDFPTGLAEFRPLGQSLDLRIGPLTARNTLFAYLEQLKNLKTGLAASPI
jgi:hypothetical protein